MRALFSGNGLLSIAAGWSALVCALLTVIFATTGLGGLVYGILVFGTAAVIFAIVAKRADSVLSSPRRRRWLIGSASLSFVVAFLTFSPLGLAFFVLSFLSFIGLALMPRQL